MTSAQQPRVIMVVDDEPDIATVIQKALKKYNLEVEPFNDPKQALDSFRAHPSGYALVITDIRMPGMSGIELADHIWKVRPEIKVLFMTAYLREVDNTLIPAVHKKNIIEKPAQIQKICDEVKLRLPPSQ